MDLLDKIKLLCHNDSMPTGMYKRTGIKDSVSRFWTYVEKLSNVECWEWKAHKDIQGYGQFTTNGKHFRSNRFAWELTHGAIPLKQMVCHACHNPSCCNPAHLYLGDNTDNMKDMVLAERSCHGERNPSAKLTHAEVLKVREMYSTGQHSHRALATIFNVGKTTIAQIVRRETWTLL